MTVQPPLPLEVEATVRVGQAASVCIDASGGRVFLRGELVFAWDDGDEAARQLAAVQLVRLKAASRTQVAEVFGVDRVTVLRWDRALARSGVAGLVPAKRGPKGPSKITEELAAQLRAARAQGASLATVSARFGVSTASVRRAVTAGAPVPQDDAEPEHPDTEPDADAGVLPVLGVPAPRGPERAAARAGVLSAAVPVFTGCARVPLAGLFLAFPGLERTGLLGAAAEVFADAPGGFYGRDTMLIEGVLRALAGQPLAEGASRIDPVALGRVLGMDRAPEVKTIRRRIAALAGLGRGAQLQAALASRLVAASENDEQVGALFYVDGHVRAYQGTRPVGKTHSARLRFPAPATLETWVSNGHGDPVLVVMAAPSASLAGELRRLMPQLREVVGDDRRVLVGFDRGGWSPALFADLHAGGFDTLTWRKGPSGDIDSDRFTEVSYTDPHTGVTGTWIAADTRVDLPVGDTGRVFPMRQITRWYDTGTGPRQAHVLTTRTDLPAGQVLHLMGSRWRQENYFRYARIHFDLDSHDTYTATGDDPERTVPNPARTAAHKTLQAARAAYDRATAGADAALLDLHTPPAGATTWTITNPAITAATADQRAAATRLAAAQAAYQATPPRLPLHQVDPDRQILDTETKLLTHAIRMAAYNTITALARDIRLNTGYPRATDEAHTLATSALTATGDIQPGPDTLTITLDPLPTPRATRALTELCTHLTTTQTRYPGTNLTLHYTTRTTP